MHESRLRQKEMRIPSSPISIKERNSMLFLRYGLIDIQDGAFVLVDEKGVRIHIPVGGVACLFLEPGTTITHAAVSLAADTGTLLVWVGESGVRLYASGQPGGARADKLLYQARLALDDDLRLKVVRAMYKFRFKAEPPARRSIEQLRGIEGVRVRTMYELLAKKYEVIPGKTGNTILTTGTRLILSTGPSALPIMRCTVFARPPYSPPAMLRQ